MKKTLSLLLGILLGLALVVGTCTFTDFSQSSHSSEITSTINKIQKAVSDKKQDRDAQITELLTFTSEVANLIGLDPSELEEPYQIGKWELVGANRHLNGWCYVFEAYPRGLKSIGYTNGDNPEWVDPKGTATVVLMPEDMRKKFIDALKAHIR